MNVGGCKKEDESTEHMLSRSKYKELLARHNLHLGKEGAD